MFNPFRLFRILPLFLVATILAASELPSPADEFGGVVAETMNSGGYIYLNIEHDSGSVWVATRDCVAEVGDEVRVPSSWEMRNFRSATLDRTFPTILFAPRVYVGDETPDTAGPGMLPEGHPTVPGQPKERAGETPFGDAHHGVGSAAPAVSPGQVAVAAGGQTIGECFEWREALAGKRVKVRGIVVKYTPDVLGVNWVHLRDGTGGQGTNDLVLTTKETVKVGDIVLAEGIIDYDKKIGAGYSFPAIIEDASVKVEARNVETPIDIRS